MVGAGKIRLRLWNVANRRGANVVCGKATAGDEHGGDISRWLWMASAERKHTGGYVVGMKSFLGKCALIWWVRASGLDWL